jgi:hypothetical protein
MNICHTQILDSQNYPPVKGTRKPGMVARALTLALGKVRQEDCKFDSSELHIETLSQKQNNPHFF